MKKKIFVLGIDGASLDTINRMLKTNKIPFIKKLMNKGVVADLKSTMPPISCPAWASFGTAKNPGKYGTFSFSDKRENSYELNLNYNILNKIKGFWDYLNEKGIKTGLLNIPLFGAAKKVDGFFIAGDFCEKPYFYPEKLKQEDKLGKLKIIQQWPYGTPKKTIIKDIFEMLENRLYLTEYLMNKKEWDLLISVVQYDTLNHFNCHDKPSLENYFKKLDQWLEKNLGNREDIDIIIFGDHGADELKGRFYINNWLLNKGYLHLAQKKPLISRILPKDKIEIAVTKLGMAKMLMKIIPKRIKQKWPESEISFEHLQIDWKKTKAFACGDCYTGSIYINKKEREPRGIIDRQGYKILIKQISEELNQLKGPNGEELKINIFYPWEIYTGKYAKNAPDIIYMINDMQFTTNFSLRSRNKNLFGSSRKEGDHRPKGMIIANGPHFKENRIHDMINIMDIGPTIMHIFGLEIPSDFDGRVLTEFLKETSNVKINSELDDSTLEEIERINKSISKIKFTRKWGEE